MFHKTYFTTSSYVISISNVTKFQRIAVGRNIKCTSHMVAYLFSETTISSTILTKFYNGDLE